MQKEITKCKSIKNYVKTLCNYLTLDDELTLPALISLLVTIAQTQYTELIKIQLELCLAHSIGDIRDRLILYLSQLNVSNTSHINTEELQDYLKINKEELINLNERYIIKFAAYKQNGAEVPYHISDINYSCLSLIKSAWPRYTAYMEFIYAFLQRQVKWFEQV